MNDPATKEDVARLEKRIDRCFDGLIQELRVVVETLQAEIRKETQRVEPKKTTSAGPRVTDRPDLHLRDRIDQDFLKELGL